MGKITVTAIAGAKGPELEIRVDNCPPARSGTYRAGATFELNMRGMANLSPLTATTRRIPISEPVEPTATG